MNFFKPEDYEKFCDFSGWFAKVYKRYCKHLDQIEAKLPLDMQKIVRPCGLEDGLIVQAWHDEAEHELVIRMRCGHLQMGYSDLWLKYSDAEVMELDSLKQICLATKSHRIYENDFSYHEADILPDGRLEHRIMFSRGIWFGVRAKEIQVERIPQPSRRIPTIESRFRAMPLPRKWAQKVWPEPKSSTHSKKL